MQKNNASSLTLASMRSIAIDVGNTRIKAALFEEQKLVELASCSDTEELVSWCSQQQASHAIVATTKGSADLLAEALSPFLSVLQLHYGLPLPIGLAYDTPHTLGVDRIAAAVGGAVYFPAQPVLVFDAGTCLTHELLSSKGVYEGGAISPGLSMRLQAMHTFTAKLPLASLEQEPDPPLTGKSTLECLKSGAFWGMLNEIESTALRYKEMYPYLKVILCGGDAKTFEKKLKEHIFVVPELVLFGLNEILRYNVLQKKCSAPAV